MIRATQKSAQAPSGKTTAQMQQPTEAGVLTEPWAHLVQALGDMSSEMAQFIAKRIDESMKVQQDLMHCRSIADIRHVQLSFFEEAFKQYQGGVVRMFDIGTHALQERPSD